MSVATAEQNLFCYGGSFITVISQNLNVLLWPFLLKVVHDFLQTDEVLRLENDWSDITHELFVYQINILGNHLPSSGI